MFFSVPLRARPQELDWFWHSGADPDHAGVIRGSGPGLSPRIVLFPSTKGENSRDAVGFFPESCEKIGPRPRQEEAPRGSAAVSLFAICGRLNVPEANVCLFFRVECLAVAAASLFGYPHASLAQRQRPLRTETLLSRAVTRSPGPSRRGNNQTICRSGSSGNTEEQSALQSGGNAGEDGVTEAHQGLLFVLDLGLGTRLATIRRYLIKTADLDPTHSPFFPCPVRSR